MRVAFVLRSAEVQPLF